MSETGFFVYFTVRHFGAPLLLSAVAIAVLSSFLSRSFRLSLWAGFVFAALLGSWAASFASGPRQPITEPHSPAEHTAAGFIV